MECFLHVCSTVVLHYSNADPFLVPLLNAIGYPLGRIHEPACRDPVALSPGPRQAHMSTVRRSKEKVLSFAVCCCFASEGTSQRGVRRTRTHTHTRALIHTRTCTLIQTRHFNPEILFYHVCVNGEFIPTHTHTLIKVLFKTPCVLSIQHFSPLMGDDCTVAFQYFISKYLHFS